MVPSKVWISNINPPATFNLIAAELDKSAILTISTV